MAMPTREMFPRNMPWSRAPRFPGSRTVRMDTRLRTAKLRSTSASFHSRKGTFTTSSRSAWKELRNSWMGSSTLNTRALICLRALSVKKWIPLRK